MKKLSMDIFARVFHFFVTEIVLPTLTRRKKEKEEDKKIKKQNDRDKTRKIIITFFFLSVFFERTAQFLFFLYKSSSSSGNAAFCASAISFSYSLIFSLSIWTSAGIRAGIAVNSRLASPANLRANQRNGFSKL